MPTYDSLIDGGKTAITETIQPAATEVDVLDPSVLPDGVSSGETFPFMATISFGVTYPDANDDPFSEIVSVTNIVGNTCTIVRAQEGTTASEHDTGKRFQVNLLAEHIRALVREKADLDMDAGPFTEQLRTTGNGLSWRNGPIELISARPGPGISAPGFAKLTDDGSGSAGVFADHFSSGTTESLMFSYTLDQPWAEETDVHFHIHWGGTDGNAGNVNWKVEYIWMNDGDATDGNTSTVSVVVANPGLVLTETNFPDITGTGFTTGAIFVGRLYRDTGASDTYGSDVVGISLGLHHQVDGIGGAEEDSKD